WGTWIVETSGLERLQLSPDVVQLLVRRLDELSDTAKDVLGVAAVFGPQFEGDLLRKVWPGGPSTIERAIAEAARLNLIETRAAGEFAFVHDRLRDDLLARLDARTIRSWHQRIAEALDRPGVDQSDTVYVLARHYSLGETERNGKRVYETCVAAGRRAVAK